MPRTRRTRTSTRIRTSAAYLTAEIGRFDQELKKVPFRAGDTIGQLLDKAGITLHEGENVSDMNGNSVTLNDQARNKEEYFIVGTYKSGDESEEEIEDEE